MTNINTTKFTEESAKEYWLKDPLNAGLAEYFFYGKTAPHLVNDYDVIGFDENSFVSYDMKEMSGLVIRLFLKDLFQNMDLYNKQYVNDFPYEKTSDFMLQGVVWGFV